MPKLSVYVPDSLFEQARSLDTQANTSRLVQRALQRLVAEGEERPLYAGARPARADKQLAHLREKLATEARADYERGYSDALTAAESLPWWALEGLADNNFDLPRWCDGWFNAEQHRIDAAVSGRQLVEGDKGPAWVTEIGHYLGRLINPIDDWTPGRSYLRGFSDALRDAWDSVEHGRTRQGVGTSAAVEEAGADDALNERD